MTNQTADAAALLASQAGVLASSCQDLTASGDGSLVEAMCSVELAQRAVDAARVALLGELDARDEPVRRTGLVTSGWLAYEFLLPRQLAVQRVTVSRKLRSVLTLINQALLDGVITFDHAALLTRLCTPRVRDTMVALQPHLVALAVGVRFEQWANDVRALILLADQDGGHDPNPETNHLSLTDGLSGEIHLSADLVGEAAAHLRAALLKELESRYRFHRNLTRNDPSHQFPTRNQLLAEALIELTRRGTASTAGLAASAPPVTDVTLVINASDPVHASTPDGVCLADGTTRVLNCDATLTAVVVNSLGVPLDLGRSVRYFNHNQRRAIMIRDGGCVHPGCEAPPAWARLHHITHHQHGGNTNISNAVSLCQAHHQLIHHGWSITPNPQTNSYLITSPAGITLQSQRNLRPHSASQKAATSQLGP